MKFFFILIANRSWFLHFISKTKHLHKNCQFLKNILKLSILPIESVFIIEFHVGLKVKNPKIFYDLVLFLNKE